MMDKKVFFSNIKTGLFGILNKDQVFGVEKIIDEFYLSGQTNKYYLAYILATVYHETARTMQPIEEFGKGRNYDYGKRLKMSRKPYSDTKNLFYGRGFVQLTWYENYEKMGKKLGLDLINNPDLVLNIDISVKILIAGMLDGDFTGKKLRNFITKTGYDFANARKIINGKDKAQLIANYAERFLYAIEKSTTI